ncbi:MAG: tetratricopeptide repeat protein [Deltaproteobacteria bacterium]|nr:tetratricopeptide repeat protein [Deltaproteobacteria bacterium]
MSALLATLVLAGQFDLETIAGHKALSEWQLPQARAIAEELVQKAPKDPDVLELASRVQFHRGEYQSAASLYALAIEQGDEPDPYYANIVTRTEQMTRGYLEKESPHFRIAYPAGKDAIFADYALPVLEAAYIRIAQDLGLVPDPSDKIAVLVVPDAEGLATVSTLLPVEIEKTGTIAICKFNRLMVTSPLATYYGYDWADTLAHEYTHLVINLVSKNRVPIWLHEGIAKFVETRWDGEAGRALSPGSVNLLASAAKTGKFIPFEKMHPSMAKLPSQEDSGLAFAEVFVAIQMLQEKRGMSALKDVLAKIGQGAEVETAVASVYGKTFAQFLIDWREKLKTFKGKTLAGAQISKIALKDRRSKEDLSDELEPIQEKKVQDFARLGELLHLRGRTKAAAVEYEKAYTVAGPRYPSLSNKLAMALIQNGDDTRAEAILKELLVPHPQFAPAHLALGRLAMKRNDSAGAKTHYMAALYQNPFNPEIHQALQKLEIGPAVDTAKRHGEWASGKELPKPKEQPKGDERLSIFYAPFGRARLANGVTIAYPIAGAAVPKDTKDVELLARDGKTKIESTKRSTRDQLEVVGSF